MLRLAGFAYFLFKFVEGILSQAFIIAPDGFLIWLVHLTLGNNVFSVANWKNHSKKARGGQHSTLAYRMNLIVLLTTAKNKRL